MGIDARALGRAALRLRRSGVRQAKQSFRYNERKHEHGDAGRFRSVGNGSIGRRLTYEAVTGKTVISESSHLQNGFSLIDSAQRAQDHSDSWAHPHQEVLGQIEAGYFVKVGVTHSELSGERFWGIVRERRGRKLVIQVDQDLIYTTQHGIRDRDILTVDEGNVFGITDSRGTVVWEAK